jgi:hypothetical protein
MTDDIAYRNALMWAFDRLGVDGGMTAREQLHTMREIGKVLCGRPSPAATYEPNDWDDSAALKADAGVAGEEQVRRPS